MKVSISRSVGRAFAVMEVFRETRQPASATQLSRRLDAPHSSVVAVLHNLRDLGYLSFDQTNMTYFPTAKLLDLTGWMRPAARDHGRLGVLLERVARDTGHMTALSSRLSLFVNTVAMRPGRFNTVAGPARAVGSALTASIAGLAILAQLDDDEVQDVFRETEMWLRDAGARKPLDVASTLAGIEAVRRRGLLTGGHPGCRGTEIMAFAVKAADGAPMALSVHIPTYLSPEGKAEIRQLVEARIRQREVGIAKDLGPSLPPMAASPAPKRAIL